MIYKQNSQNKKKESMNTFASVSNHVYNKLFLIGKYGFEIRKMIYFYNLFEKNIKILQESFSGSEIIHLPQTHNLKADNLVQNIKKQSIFVTHMNAELSL